LFSPEAVPISSAVPPVETENQSIVSPEPAVAAIVRLPEPQLEPITTFVGAAGKPFIVTLWLPEADLQPLLKVTVTASVTEPETPAVKTMLLVPLPAVIVPLVIVHA